MMGWDPCISAGGSLSEKWMPHPDRNKAFFFRFDCNAFMLVYFLIACHKNPN